MGGGDRRVGGDGQCGRWLAAAAAAAVEPPSLGRTSPNTRTEFCTRRQFLFAVTSWDLLGDIIDAARASMVGICTGSTGTRAGTNQPSIVTTSSFRSLPHPSSRADHPIADRVTTARCPGPAAHAPGSAGLTLTPSQPGPAVCRDREVGVDTATTVTTCHSQNRRRYLR